MNGTLQCLIARLQDLKTETDIEQAVKDQIAAAGTFKDKDWKILGCRTDYFSKWDEHFLAVVEGAVHLFSDNNPLSHDGYSCTMLKFCITIINDDIWGYRMYCDSADR